jgi:hypothetical protein
MVISHPWFFLSSHHVTDRNNAEDPGTNPTGLLLQTILF